MKKVLFLSHEASLTGAPLFLVKFIRYLKYEYSGYEIVIFFTKNGDLVELVIQEGFDVILSEKRSGLKSKMPVVWNRLIHYFRYLKLLLTFRPHLVYSNTIVNFGEVVLAGLAKIPVLIHMHEGMSFSSKCRYRLRFSCFFAKQIIVGSHYVNTVLTYLTGRTGIVIYNGVDSKVDISIKETQKNRPFTLGVLGTICENKGQLVAIQAMRLLVEKGISVDLKIAGGVGDYEYYTQLSYFINLHSLEGEVTFVGMVPDKDDFLRSIDVLIVPSFDESFPTVILEAFSMGTLVVATDVGGIPEMIQNDVNGLLFRSGDFMILADIIENIIHDNSMFHGLPLSALRILTERFDVCSTHQLLIDVINNLREE